MKIIQFAILSGIIYGLGDNGKIYVVQKSSPYHKTDEQYNFRDHWEEIEIKLPKE